MQQARVRILWAPESRHWLVCHIQVRYRLGALICSDGLLPVSLARLVDFFLMLFFFPFHLNFLLSEVHGLRLTLAQTVGGVSISSTLFLKFVLTI